MSRGVEGTFIWFVEEVGELAEAIRKRDIDSIKNEVADVIAWLLSLTNVLEIDAETTFIDKYGNGCPKCRKKLCDC